MFYKIAAASSYIVAQEPAIVVRINDKAQPLHAIVVR